MLHLAPLPTDDEPVAAPAAPAPTRAKPRYDEREIGRRALKFWPVLKDMVMDGRGRPLGEVAGLNPNYVAIDPSKRRPDGPKLTELRGPSPWDGGSWHSLTNGASGPDIISLVAYLGECDRRTAAEWLGRLVDRLVEIP
jgi:hypothetical protein